MKRAISFLLSLIIISFAGMNASGESYGKVYCKNGAEAKKIALTFDDGPHPRYTKQILDILEEYGVTATFFIIGVNAVNYPESLKLIVDSGCEIGNHTYSHVRIDKMGEDEIYSEITRCQELLVEMTGKCPTLFRPPEGRVPASLLSVMKNLDYTVVLWSVDTLDWSHRSSSDIYSSVMTTVQGGDIILMHDYVSGRNTTCEALRRIIPELLSQGYEFVTVSELLNCA